MTNSPTAFQTPPRILIPKLLKSREGWKTKANQRKKLLKAVHIRNRDLEASREAWKTKALDAQSRIAQLEDRVEQLEHDAAKARPETSMPLGRGW